VVSGQPSLVVDKNLFCGVNDVAQVEGPAEPVQRVAALDVARTSLTACLRVPHQNKSGRRRQEVREFSTLSASLLELADWLRYERVELVAIQAVGDGWKPAFYLLEAEGFTCWLVNAREVRSVPGRPRTDKLDVVWLAKVVERGRCQPSLVHPKPIRQLRDLTRYRRSLIQERGREKQRCAMLLEDAQIAISSVIGDLFGGSGRAVLEGMIAGQRDPRALAELAGGSGLVNTDALVEALTGHFEDHHAFLVQAMLRHIDAITAAIDAVSVRIEAVIAPFGRTVVRLDEITGVGQVAAQELIAEIGVDVTRFPTAEQLVSWARFVPIDDACAVRKRGGSTGRGNKWLSGTLGEIVAGVARTDTFLGECYRGLATRRGKNSATVTIGNSLLTIIWHLFSEPDVRYHDLEAALSPTAINTQHPQRDLVRQLERLTGQKVTLVPPSEHRAA
jgi:transposase